MPGQPHYNLKDIRSLLRNDYFYVKGEAQKTAEKDFEWGDNDIKKALLKLTKNHFHKSVTHWDYPSIYVDHYRAPGLMGENVYTHFHVQDGQLIIASFKEL